jgi:hypothetical protein
MRAIVLCTILALFAPVSTLISYAQAPVNPDISVIADTRLSIHNDQESRPEQADKIQLEFDELEIDLNGYLNPFARADVALALPGSEEIIEIEEAYLTLLRGLPLKMQLRIGKLQPDFGKINTQHPHAWSWISRPLMFEEVFGEDGLHDVGVNLSSLIPVGSSALGLSVTILQTGNLINSAADDTSITFDENIPRSLASLARVSLFAPLGIYTSMEIGFSYLRAQEAFNPDERQFANLGNFDLKLKWRPNAYQSLALVAEAVLNNHKIATQDTITLDYNVEKMNSFGAFASLDYQFRKRFDVGAFYDFTQLPGSSDQNRSGYGFFAGFNLAEETTRFGLLVRRDQGTEMENYNSAVLQILWALGPHKPHQF